MQEPEVVADYFDGQAFLSACHEKRANFGKAKTLYLALSADGVEYSTKPSKSVWPFSLEIINFPPKMRRKFENAIIVGILFGYPKDMTSVLKYLTDELRMWDHGEWKLQFCYLIADTPALNKLLGLVGHIGMVKCPQHMNRGFYSPQHNTYYMPNELPRSNSDNREALSHASNASASGTKIGSDIDRLDSTVREGLSKLSLAGTDDERTRVKQEYGLSGKATPLNTLPGFLYHTAATYEALHISLLGVGRLVMKLFCSKHKSYPGDTQSFHLSDAQLIEISLDVDSFSKSIHPQLMPRRIRSPKDGLALRAEDMSNLLFLLPVLLHDRLDQNHVKGVAEFVKSIALMAQTSLNREERDALDKSTTKFLTYFYRTFYQRSVDRISVCTYVVHRFGDAPQLLRLHGPGWTTWSFFVETLGNLISGSIKSLSNPEASVARTVQHARRLATTIPLLNARIRSAQLRRVRYHSSHRPYTPKHVHRPGTGNEVVEEYDSELDECEEDMDGELLVATSSIHQLPQDAFEALIRFRWPNAKRPAEINTLIRDVGSSLQGKYVTTFRKMKMNGFVFVSGDSSKPGRRDRCYAILRTDQDDVVVQIQTFFNHCYNGYAFDLLAYRQPISPTIHPAVGELSFQKWSTVKVAPVTAIQRPAAVVFLRPTGGRSTLGRYFYVRRVEMLQRIRFDEAT